MFQSKEKIKARIIVPVILALIAVVLIFISSFYHLQTQQIDKDIHQRIKGVGVAFDSMLGTETETLDGLLDFIKEDKGIQAAWLAKDREMLYQAASSVYKKINIDNRVTHFYFIEKNKKCFLREHEKARYGDIINRFTLEQAVLSGKKASGIELGTLGTFTLRTVHPWYINGELTGYIELGVEITHITPKLRELFDVEILLLVKKEFLEREKWEEGSRLLNHETDWNRYDDFVIIESSLPDIEVGISAYQQHMESHKKGVYSMDTHDLESGNKIYHAGFSPLIDADGRDVGEFITLSDITETKTSLRDTTRLVILISFSILVILIIFFYFYISRLEKRFVANHEKALSETRKSEKAMEDAKNAAISASQVKSQFFANISHEFRTPMNGIKGMLQLLKETKPDEEQAQYIDIAMNSGNELMNLIDNVLEYSQIDAGNVKFENIDFDLTELIKYEVGIFIEKAQAKGIKLSFSINEHTPATINSDPEKLKHILHSLLDNAIKFTAQGEVKVNVNTAQRASVSMLHISISDTGISIPKEQQDKIFEVCTQADGSTTRGFGGLGLGLSITRKLVEQMGGEISLQTTPDVGSTFSIYLPFQETTS